MAESKKMADRNDALYRTTFAIRKDLKDPLLNTVEKIGLGSVSDLLSFMALRGDEIAQALQPIAADYMANKVVVHRGRGKATVLREQMAQLSDEEQLALLQELKARHAQG